MADLRISARTAEKLNGKHGLHPDRIRAAVVGQHNLHYSWDLHSERGRRALVKVMVDGRKVLVVLYPRTGSDPHSFNLGSAYPI